MEFVISSRGLQSAKNDFGLVSQKSCGFQFSFTKLTVVSISGSFFYIPLSMPSFNYACMPWYNARNDVLLCRVGPTNCQPK